MFVLSFSSYSIGDHSDRFYVEQIGDRALVRITRGLDNQTLDRETSEQYNVEILAIDKGMFICMEFSKVRYNFLGSLQI